MRENIPYLCQFIAQHWLRVIQFALFCIYTPCNTSPEIFLLGYQPVNAQATDSSVWSHLLPEAKSH